MATTEINANINPYTGKPFTTADLSGMGVATTKDFWNFYNQGLIQNGKYIGEAGVVGTGGWGTNAPQPYNVGAPAIKAPEFKMPSWEEFSGQIPAAPAYKPSAETLAWQERIGGNLENILEQGGIGIPEETKEQLYLREAETINASTTQAIKNLEDEMAAKGMSNSGLAFSEKMKLQAKGDIARANVMRDVEIQDAMMKLASYENALALSVQFVSYLSEESWRAYQPKLATWEAKVTFYRDAIQQAYYEHNLALTHQYNMELAQFEADTNLQMAEMELEAQNQAAKSQGIGYVIGAVLGGIFGS
jgi:hypothetical protein